MEKTNDLLYDGMNKVDCKAKHDKQNCRNYNNNASKIRKEFKKGVIL